MVSFLQFVASILPGAIASTAVTSMPTTLNITVIGARNNLSTLECWSLEPGFTSSTQPGIAGSASLSLGPVGDNATYTIVPARLDGGIHNAPVRQWVIFLSGLAHITLPHSEDEAWILGGKHGTILALDTADVSADGHYTKYPSDEVTVAMAVPLGDEEPAHQVLYQGACKATEVDF
ncbi:hypothetical protein ALT_5529 [Aspergillus lentulus]|uniref:Small secreted protein n=1 Tax=Aspergillus lentulus TaxID=293939 RepID=A0AAN6BKE9_ASPLE|nr:uncharacterized protein IFM58399_00279 [Aspergillus lentulus]KAF4158970.1 hypothetical protein CNMCM6069_002868 [Aspergillus lentulus]KAF4180133.1 hypothetical protein CNMCM8060_001881 [Aspergillus lentulus]KAF4185691.1 hypothetical protein CNMCM7927_006382 [Aspergillus lentulus]KAF4197050.1 hypothetical protein CNMCM8694_003817 [Aspergillus lentulus]KAF4197973.1 hypothetical protein CNMCM8927_006562 [Aspergillus lentulus]